MNSLFDFIPVVTTHSFYRGRHNFMLPQDTHPGWVILAAEAGEFEYSFNDNKGVASFGDLVLCPPNTLLKRRSLTTLSYHFILFTWQTDINEEQLLSSIPSGKIVIENKERLAENFRYMKSASQLMDGNRMKRISQLLLDIWYMYSFESSPTMPTSDRRPKDPALEQIVALLNEQAFNRRLILKEIAAEYKMSPVQFTRLFFDAVGTTPIHYLNTIRIQKAQSLLLESKLTLQQIAEECGYDNGFYLSRVFKTKVGISPSEFRKLNQI